MLARVRRDKYSKFSKMETAMLVDAGGHFDKFHDSELAQLVSGTRICL